MKSKLFIMVLATVLLLTACSDTAPQDNNITSASEQNENPVSAQESNNSSEEIHYNLISADWPVYKDVKELTNAGNVIVLGKYLTVQPPNLLRLILKLRTAI